MAKLPYECELHAGDTLTMSVDLGGGYFDAWVITVRTIAPARVELRVDTPPAVRVKPRCAHWDRVFTIHGWDLR